MEEKDTSVTNDALITKYISIDDFAKVEIKLGTIIDAKEVEGSDKLYQLTVDFGELSPRNVMSGIKKFRKVDELVGKQFPFVTNLAPRKMMGKYISEAMILAASSEGAAGNIADSLDMSSTFSLFPSENKLPNGTQLR